ncbi:aminotransferase class I/II-fold pyridoxal phosphate-dependent enzyme [Maribacter halichondriae]|uniref:aminotransferase class I/II-fold pyridoxal phosphate-dependent enzyme n=1 Tax=Maribacter halichondriae TaxID=2980554 RepID=UPI0030763A74
MLHLAYMAEFPKKLQKKLSERKAQNAFRRLPTPHNLMDFSSNDYLGLAKNEAIYADTFQLLLKKGISENGASGSRLLTGNHSLYAELETRLCEFHAVESALVFNSGYDANLGFFSAVPQRGDFVFYDELIHASIRDGIKMGNAKSYKFKHNDLEDLKSKILLSLQAESRSTDCEVYIVTESVFSMDGDTPDLKAMSDFGKKEGYHLIIDEAHAIGVFGKNGSGIVQHMAIQDAIFARIVTFGKSIGAHGAAIIGSKALVDYLINFSRSFIYTTALSPHTIATISSAYRYLGTQEGESTEGCYKIIFLVLN